MTLRSIFRRLSIKRFMALAAVICFASSWLEAAIPDVHDGDADGTPGAQPSWVSASPDANLSGSTAVPHSSAPSHVPTTPGTSHTFHVDHCGHSHVASSVAKVIVTASPLDHECVIASPVMRPVSVDLPAHFRPPIA